MKTLLERFEAKYEPVPESGCWLWTASINNLGYGQIQNGKRTVNGHFRPFLAHRVSWELYKGPIPNGMCVLHRCDVQCCVNPEHLFIGTMRDNTMDMRRKGRWHANEKWFAYESRRKLTNEQIIEIRHSQEKTGVLMKKFGVKRHAIADVKAGRTWKKVEG